MNQPVLKPPPTDQEWNDWRWQLRNAARSPIALQKLGVITHNEAVTLGAVTQHFKMLVTPYYLSLIDSVAPHCPIRKQAIPDINELTISAHEHNDPIGDRRNAPTPILVHRYPDRILLFPTYF